MTIENIIVCNNLKANTAPESYKGEGLNFYIKKSSITVLTGFGDQGYNDWLKTLGGIYHPQDGVVKFFGRDSTYFNREQWSNLRKKIAYITDDVTLLSMLNGLNNVLLPGNYHKTGNPEEVKNKALSLIAQLKLEHTEHLLPADIKNDDQFLLCIIRALMLEPEVLCIENPFSSLGTDKTELLKQFLLNSILENNLTVVVSTQDVDFIKEYADKILFITLDKILIFGSVYELVNSTDEHVLKFIQAAKMV
jgi:phospholipid/cholesterol/gamma-HCH transport system ATP-binding protein